MLMIDDTNDLWYVVVLSKVLYQSVTGLASIAHGAPHALWENPNPFHSTEVTV